MNSAFQASRGIQPFPRGKARRCLRGRNPAEFVGALQTRGPAGFEALAEAVAGAYSLNPRVRVAIGYQGQVPGRSIPKLTRYWKNSCNRWLTTAPSFAPHRELKSYDEACGAAARKTIRVGSGDAKASGQFPSQNSVDTFLSFLLAYKTLPAFAEQ